MGTRKAISLAAIVTLFAAACSEEATAPFEPIEAEASLVASRGPGSVFLTSNGAAGNEIIAFDRAPDGSLVPAGTFPTGGIGTGGGLGNQASIVLTRNGRFLYTVNAGSNDISGFAVRRSGLHSVGSPVNAQGLQPISLTVHGNLLYVLNAGGSGGIAGFRIGRNGSLTPIPGSVRPLGSAAAGPAQIQFSPDGRVLIVTEKATNTLTTYRIGDNGRAGDPVTQASAGQTPFGFNFNRRGDLVVSEAAGGAAGASSASSYRVNRDGTLRLISGAVPTTQSAACWIAVAPNGRFAITTNTGSGTISRLTIGPDGGLTLADPVAAVTGTGSLPQDAAFTPGGQFLYVRNAAGTVGAFRVGEHGNLTHIGDFGPLPAGANGIAAL